MTASVIELIRRVESLGGQITRDGGDLHVTAPEPLPEDLLAALSREKPVVLIALGAPFDVAISTIINEVRPSLPPALRTLSDTKLLALINWSVMDAWVKALRKLESNDR
jgi:hypothetical protein